MSDASLPPGAPSGTLEIVRLRVDGRTVEALPGASLAAALMAEGIRGFRVARRGGARGPLCGMGTCFECRVTVDGEAHIRACILPVREGMEVTTGG